MGNQFDSANYPTKEPTSLVAGDYIAWKRVDLGSDYPPASYQLKYSARLEGSTATEVEITASESGSDYLVEVPAANSAGWTPGLYHWQAYIIRSSDSERITVSSGIFEVKANRDLSTADPRSNKKQALDALEATILNLQTGSVKSVSIFGKTVTYHDLPNLIQQYNHLKSEYQKELDKAHLDKYGVNPRKVGLRLRR